MMKEYDVIVVGAGPAGATCASYLSRAGIDVLLLDKERFPRDKPCGGSQTAMAMAHVTELGAFDEVAAAGYPNKGLLLTAPDYSKCYLEAPGERRTTPRIIFDNIMKNTAVKWGAELWEGCWVYDVLRQGEQVCGVRARYEGQDLELRARIVIGADGAHSVIAQALDMFPDDLSHVAVAMCSYFEGVPMEDYLEFHFDRHMLPCYLWIFPTGTQAGLVNVGLGIRADIYHATSLSGYFQQFVRTNPYGARLVDARQVSEWRCSRIPCGTQAGPNYAPGVMLIGDAGSFALPLTGEGVGPAMESAKLAADAAIVALDSKDCSAEVLCKYHQKWQAAHILKYRNMKVMEDAFCNVADVNGLVRKFISDESFKHEMLKTMFFVGARSAGRNGC